MKKKKDNNNQSKFKKILTIINPRTILGQCIILGTIIVVSVLVWFITVTIISVNAFINTTADKMAFSTDEDVDLNSVTRVNDEDLTAFYVYLECTNYDSKYEKEATFVAYFYQDKESEDDVTEVTSSKITTKLLVTADYMNETFYSASSGTVSKFATDLQTAKDSSSYYKKFSSLDVVELPSKTDTITLWPYSLKKVSKPIVYLYVSYTEKTTNKTYKYLIRFEFDDITFTGVVA